MASTPSYPDSLEWITAYLTIHSLSIPSRRYSFLLWLAVAVMFLAFAVLHWTGLDGGWIGAVWSKWTLRRRTWRKKHTLARAKRTKNPVSLPSDAQLLSLAVLILASLALAFIGPDYLAPSLKVWQVRTDSSSPPSQLYDTWTFIPLMPQYTVSKSLWSSSARTGQIAFALLPLCVLFTLKAPPFAIFALPFTIQLYFDKLARLHKWAGRLIWFLVFIHVVLWSIQLSKDVNPSTGRVAYVYAWSYIHFIYGWIAFALLTLIILLSIHPIRRHFYESFYLLHVLLVPCMLVTAGLHHPTVAWWCWAALSIWVGERLWRGTWWIYANGIVSGMTRPAPFFFKSLPRDAWEMDDVRRSSYETTPSYLPIDERTPSPLEAHYLNNRSPILPDCDTPRSRQSSPLVHSAEQSPFGVSFSPLSPDLPPPGYVHAELLSGRTVRLRLITPGFLPWSPGQHFLLNIPSVSRFTSHPFTCASVCDEAAPTDAGRIMLFLVRAKSGWTRDLWDLVSRMTSEQPRGDVSPAYALGSLPKKGVLLRAYVDGPFGSARRTRWGNYSTAIIISGGSGVSFGLSVLQYMCMCLAGRNGTQLGGRRDWRRKCVDLKRVRFIWLVREYCHVQWCASVIRHCMSIAPLSALQVDIYVTNFKPVLLRHPTLPAPPLAHLELEPTKGEELQPPHPNFVRENSARLGSGSTDSLESHGSCESDVDLGYYLGESSDDEPTADEMSIVHETNILDLTNFDGDVDVVVPGEAHFSRTLKKEGKLRRLNSRKPFVTKGKLLHPLANGEAQTRRARESRQAYPDQYRAPSRLSQISQPQKTLTSTTQLVDGQLTTSSPLTERPNSSSPETDWYSMPSGHSESSRHPYLPTKSVPPSSDFLSTGSRRFPPYSVKSYEDVESGSGRLRPGQLPPLVMNLRSDESHLGVFSGLDAELALRIDKQEAIDVSVVSERARPGKPKLDRVIADEVLASKGAIVVACCGPASLNAMVRKIVASQIDPRRVYRGDMRGSITLVSEEFQY